MIGKRRKFAAVGTIGLATTLVLAGCAGGGSGGDVAMLDSLGESEGSVSILAWPGYVEDGTNDPAIDWTYRFRKLLVAR